MHDCESKNVETLGLHGGYDYHSGEMAVKQPIYQTSTYKFDKCADGEAFFMGEKEGYIYGRVGCPNTVLYEQRLSKIDGNEAGVVFTSGMSAVSCTCLAFAKPGDGIGIFYPVYGGTSEFFSFFCPEYGIKTHPFEINDNATEDMKDYITNLENDVNMNNIKIIYTETPTNPSMNFVDIEKICAIRDEINKTRSPENKVVVIVDNTFMGPVFQKPSKWGADITLYSCTKFLGGHSDLVAGAITGKKELIEKVRARRMLFGSTATPFTCFLLLRSLETVSIRMKQQSENCIKIFEFLEEYQKSNPGLIKKISYPLSLDKNSEQYKVFKKQCSAPGSMIAFNLKDKESAYKFADSLKLVPIAVSLGASETLCQIPYFMTHSHVEVEKKLKFGVEPGMVRLSVGLENVEDLIEDFKNAFKNVKNLQENVEKVSEIGESEK